MNVPNGAAERAAALHADVSRALDVSHLPTYGLGHRSLMWWGTAGMIVIESTVFLLAIASYFYLQYGSARWPPGGIPPELRWGTVNTLILLVSMLPNHWAKQAAEAGNLRRLRLCMIAAVVSSAAFLGIRSLEFGALNVRWDSDAYGSIIWLLLGLHTAHMLTDAYDTLVLTVLLHIGPLEGKRMVDASENAMYWYFVVFSWLPIYFVIYWTPRLI